MSDDGNRYDDDKIIDITDYVSNKQSNNDSDATMEKLTSNFISQLAVVVAISIILLKLYA